VRSVNRTLLIQPNGFQHFINHFGGNSSSRSRGNKSLMGSTKYHFANALQYTIVWYEAKLQALETIAIEFGCDVEYGAYPHLTFNVDSTTNW
jgi:hypothetical protein